MASVNISVQDYLTNNYNPADTVTILDTTANLQSLSAADIGNLVSNGVEFVNASTDVLTWDVSQWQAVPGGLGFDVNDLKVVSDSGANLATLSAGDLTALNGYGVSFLSPTDGVATFDVAQYQAFDTISVDTSADVTLSDTGANISGLSSTDFAGLSGKGFDVIDASDDAWSISVDQFLNLGGVTIDGSDTVTLSDLGANIAALTTSEISSLGGAGIFLIDASDDSLTIDVAQFMALGEVGLAAGDDVTVADTGANLNGLSVSDIGVMVGNNVDNLDATDGAVSFTAAQMAAIYSNLTLDDADTVTINDTGANLAAITSADFANYGESGTDVNAVDATDDAVTFSIDQLNTLFNNGITLAVGDTVTLGDSAANIDALTSADIDGYAEQGVDVIDAAGAGAYSFTVAEAQSILGSSITLAADDTVTISDTGANLAALSTTDLAALAAKGFDALDASDNALSLSVAQYQALGEVALTAGDVVTLTDTGVNLAALTAAEIGALAGAGIDAIDASDGNLRLTLTKYQALGSVALTDADDVTVVSTGAGLAGLSAAALNAMAAATVDHLDSSTDALSLNVNQANVVAVGGELGLTAADVVTLSDTGAKLAGLAAGTFTTYAANGIDLIDSTSDAVSFTVAQVNAIIGGEIGLAAGDNVTLADTSANIDALTAANIASYDAAGVDSIDSSQNATGYSFDVAAAQALIAGDISLAADDTVTLSDTGANIAALTAGEIGQLAAEGFDSIDASDDAFSLTVAQYQALGGVTLTGADTVTLSDTEANLEALSASDLGALGAAGIDIIDSTDDRLGLTVDQWKAIYYTAEIGLSGSDEVAIFDSGANIAAMTAADIGNAAGSGVGFIDATDNAISFSIAQLDALGGISFGAEDVITLADSQANIEALTGGQISGYAGLGVSIIDSTDGVLNLTAAQMTAVVNAELSFVADDTVTLVDTGANIAAMGQAIFDGLAFAGVDSIDSSNDALNLSVAQYRAIAGVVALTAGDNDVLLDTGAHLGQLSVAEIAALAGNNIDRINASDDVLALSVDQFNALGSVALVGADIVSIADTGANLATLDFSALAGKSVDAIDATDNVLSLTVAQYQSLGTVRLAAGDTVTLADTAANIGSLTTVQLAALASKGVDAIDATDNALNLSLSQINALGSVTLAAGDLVTLADTEGHIEGMSTGRIGSLAATGVDQIDSSNDVVHFTAAQAHALVGTTTKFVSGDLVTVVDTGASITAMSTSDISALASHGFDAIDASDNAFSLSTAQFTALGTVALTAADTVTLTDTGALLATLNFAQLAAKGVDLLDASNNNLNLTVAQYSSLGSVGLTAGDNVTITDTGANLKAMSAAQIGGLAAANVDAINSTTDLLTLNLDQFRALGAVNLTGADVVTIADTGANLAGILGDVSQMGSQGVDRIDATDNAATLSRAVVDALGGAGIALTAADTITMTATEANIEAMTAGNLADYAAQGVDIIDSTSDVLNLSAAQVSAMVNTGLDAAAGDDVTLTDTGANVLANLGALFGALEGAGIDQIDLTDNAIDLTVAQATALGSVSFDGTDAVTISDSSSAIEALTTAQITALGEAGVDVIDATDDQLSITVAQGRAGLLAGLSVDASDVVTLADTGANIADLSAVELGLLGEFGLSFIDATDDQLSLSVAQYDAIAAADVGLTAGDTVTLADTGAHLAAIGPAQINALSAAGIDQIDVTDDAMTIAASRFNAFVNDGFTFGTEDVITVRGTNASDNIVGGQEHDVLYGLGGSDILNGGDGADTLIGGDGGDVLQGGRGADTFVFQRTTDSVAGSADRIVNLQAADTIDVSQIDANTNLGGNQAFTIVDHFTHTAGELTIRYNSNTDQTVVKMDVNGDGVADSQFVITGDHHDFNHWVL